MPRRLSVSFFLAFWLAAIPCFCGLKAAGEKSLGGFLDPIRQKHNVPALGAAIVTSKGVDAIGVVGVRKAGTEIAATADDKWHLGSDTKAMTEAAANESWEDLIKRILFQPLGMESVGFGGVGTPGQIDQPWGHTADGKPVKENGPDTDNPPVLGPAGRVHCTLGDWAKFIADGLRGARGEKALLKPDTYRILQTPPVGGDYALGWMVVEREWGGGKVLTHAGSNRMNLAVAWVAPLRDFAVLVVTNQGGPAAFKACDEAASALINLCLQEK